MEKKGSRARARDPLSFVSCAIIEPGHMWFLVAKQKQRATYQRCYYSLEYISALSMFARYNTSNAIRMWSQEMTSSKRRGAAIRGVVCLVAAANTGALAVTIGERPAVEFHMEQSTIDAGTVSLQDVISHGKTLFDAKFNKLDGQGRPASRGDGASREPTQPDFIRTSAPDANSCSGCHNQPESGGAGDFVANVFVLAQTLDPVTESISGNFSNERNTLGMHGAGPIEMLAREMTEDLHAIREEARQMAATSGMPQTRPLVTKGVEFGHITVLPDGRIDPSGIVGVDCDLIIKPFHQKGAVVSLREFTNNAMNHHHGMQSVERFGMDTDPDQDGITNELTIGDITALAIFQAALSTPGRVFPEHPARRAAAQRGEQLFDAIRCTACHIPALELRDPNFREPNPYNPVGNATPGDVGSVLSFDMTREGLGNRLERSPSGGAIVRAYTDLKRHNLNDDELHHFNNERLAQGNLRGFATPEAFITAIPPRPTNQFLTRKLWDAGSSAPYGHRGDLTTLTEAIHYHGGEARQSRDAFFALNNDDQAAIIEFLMTLQVQPAQQTAHADLNGDGIVDARDLLELQKRWHTRRAP